MLRRHVLYPTELRARTSLRITAFDGPRNRARWAAGDAMPIRKIDAGELKGRDFEYFDFVMAAFVAILLLSNVLGAGKVASVDLPGIGQWPFGAGILFFTL